MVNETKGTDPITPMTMQHFQLGVIGLTKREHFAAMAMASYAVTDYVSNSGTPKSDIAEWSVKMADALINALNKSDNDN